MKEGVVTGRPGSRPHLSQLADQHIGDPGVAGLPRHRLGHRHCARLTAAALEPAFLAFSELLLESNTSVLAQRG